MVKITQGIRKVDGGGLHPSTDPAIDHAGNGIGLKCNPWSSGEDRGEHRRSGGIAAHAEHDVGAMFTQQAHAGQDAEGKLGGGRQLGREADAIELADLDQVQGKAGGRHEASFQAARGADKANLRRVALHQLARYS